MIANRRSPTAGNKNQGSNWIHRPRRLAIYTRDGHRCVYCRAKGPLSLDHLRPRSKGGSNDSSNLVTACMRCNVERGDTPLATWLGADVARRIRAAARRVL